MEPTVAEHVVDQLAEWHVPFAFGVAGDTVGPLLSVMGRKGTVRYIGVRQEDAAGFMASAHAKLTGDLGVCLADGGPGTVKLLNGVYDAHFDRQPVLALTGQLESAKLGTRWPQVMGQDLAFQEAAGAFNHTLAAPDQAPEVLHQAMRNALDRRDVSRIGLPKDFQQAKVASVLYPKPPYFSRPAQTPGDPALEEAAGRLNEAERPLILAGQGARRAGETLAALADALDAPVIHTLPALGTLPWDHPRNAGVVGKFGSEAAARLFAQADVVLLVGTTWWQPAYAPDAVYIQVDEQAGNVGMVFPVDLGLVGDALATLAALASRVRSAGRPDWRAEATRARGEWWKTVEERASGRAAGDKRSHPAAVVAELGDHLADDAILAIDVGDHTYWVSTGLKAKRQSVLVSGHWRSLGFALPAANAAKLADARRQVVAIAGDGGLGQVLAEFTTSVLYRLAIVCVVLNNGCFAEERHAQMRMGLDPHGVDFLNPDFAGYAEGCGGAGFRVTAPGDLRRVIGEAFRAASGGRPALVDAPVAAAMPEYPTERGDLLAAKRVPEMAHR